MLASAPMYPFPPSDTLQFFVGDAIAQVSLDPYSLQFSFESMRRLVVEHAIEHAEPDGTIWAYDCQATERPPIVLQRLLYRPIIGVERQDLRLTFRINDGSSLAVMSKLGPYESGHIEAPEIGLHRLLTNVGFSLKGNLNRSIRQPALPEPAPCSR